MAKTLRVHNLAKELGVQSKAIVAKCQDEGVPDITNHMSTVKLGLAETIRQWFGEDAPGHDTAIETSEKVDLAKVKKPRKAAKKKATAKDKDDAGDAATAVAEPPAAPKKKSTKKKTTKKKTTKKAVASTDTDADAAPAEVEAEAKPLAEPAEDTAAAAADPAEAPAVDTPNEPVAPSEPAAPATPDDVAGPAHRRPVKPGENQPVQQQGVENVPTRPTVVKPVGEQLTTIKKTALKGPKVIRVEKPEPIAPPRPRRGPGGPGGQGGNQLAPGEVPGITRSRGPQRGRGAGGGGGGMIDDGPRGGGGAGRGRGGGGGGGSRRTRTTRRSGQDTIITGPTQLSKADAEALQDKLRGATGFVKQRRRSMNRSGGAQPIAQTAAQIGGKVEVAEPITIKSLSAATGLKTGMILKYLFKQGVMATVNSPIETEKAMEVCLEYDIELEVKEMESALQTLEKEFAGREMVNVQPRPAVVTVLGHVDHGKTSLLDKVRKADVADHEDGGITQHIGAYRVTVKGSDDKDKTVVFIDTPGHAAFTQMRARGAKMTDVVVLVVAADDGIMPTTVEAISHAKAADVPLVVALNKIDLPGVDTDTNLQKIYGQLAEHGLNPTAWGGDVEVVKTSAETGQGITELLELLDLQSDVLELTADYGGPARGSIIEAEMQTGRGAVARVLVQDGQLKIGSYFVAGRSFGRVRDMTNDRGERIKEAGPATPLELSGIDGLPDAGDGFYIAESLQKAERIANDFRESERETSLARQAVTLDNFSATIKAGQAQTLNVVLKADVQGSVETLRPNLEAIGNDEVNVKVLHAAVGAITESDIDLAAASDGVILGFHTTASAAVREIAEQKGVEIRMYRVIYELTDNIKAALEGMLEPEVKETIIGQAKVLKVFRIGKLGNIAGCLVTEGAVRKKLKVRVERDGAIVTDNRGIETIRRVKDEVSEVQVGTECGIRIEGYEDLKPDDLITCYEAEEIKRTLD